jgi:6-hydroxycyclohex-1-ene-1-carbonyl-CoA dehydrogenase
MGDVVRRGWRMVATGRLAWFEEALPVTPPGWTTVEVAGCGVCHTDLSYLYGGVPTAHRGPVVLGHEIVGRLGDGRTVLVPAVSPCGECPACRRGRRTACSHSLMPGNHHDGGFATHVQVPARWLCEVPAVPELWPLAAIADAVTTPLQAIRRSGLAAGDTAVVVGAGGVGGFMVQMAVALGARVVAIDVAPDKLERARAAGAAIVIDARGLDAKLGKKELARQLVALGAESDGWHVYECSGTAPGQTLAFALLTRGGKLGVVGFSPEALPLKLSNLMALDAEAYGNWGADPALYPEALALVLAGKVDVRSAVERHPLSKAPEVLEAVQQHRLARRAVLVPEV